MSSRRIPLLKVHPPPHTRYLEETLRSGFYAEGPRVAEFEEKIRQYVGNPKTVALNSTSAGLWLSLHMAGVGPGKSVITTPMTSPGTNVAVPGLGGKILWADVEPDSGNINSDSVERLLDRYEEQTVAVIAVDWGGMPCDFDELRQAIRGRACLIEDAAHALGAEYKGQEVGAMADFTCFSFQAVKHITTGDGGMLTCLSKHAWDRARRLRWFGIDRDRPGRTFDDDLVEAGFKFHMNDIAASLGLAQLEDLPEILQRRREIARYYEKELTDFDFQKTGYECRSAYLLFTLMLDDRDRWIKKLGAEGIEASPVFCRNDTYSGFRDCTLGHDDLVNTDTFADRVLCLPVGEWLDDAQVEHIVSCLKKG